MMDFRELRKRAKVGGAKPAAVPTPPAAPPLHADPETVQPPDTALETEGDTAIVSASTADIDTGVADVVVDLATDSSGDTGDSSDTVDTNIWDDVAEGIEIMRLRLSREFFAIYLDQIEEIVKPKPFTAVPRTPAWVLGLLSLRGTMIPVADLRLRLGLAAEASDTARIVVVTHNNELCGLLVDEVLNVETIRLESIEAIPAALQDAAGRFLHGLLRMGGDLVALIDLDSVLTLEGEGNEQFG